MNNMKTISTSGAPAPAGHYSQAIVHDGLVFVNVLLESLELCGIKVAMPDDGACVFTGRSAIYSGPEASFDDGKGHVLLRDLPQGVCDKTAAALAALGRCDITVTPSTWHYNGGGCC